MDWDDIDKRSRKSGTAIGDNLETLSVAELTERIAALEAEIHRTKAELEKKRAHEKSAAALFKPKS